MTKFLKLSFLFCLSILVFAACEKDELNPTDDSLQFFIDADEDETADALLMPVSTELQALSSSFSSELRHRFHGDCFTLVFPVEVSFPDGTTATVNSGTEMKQTVRDWVAAGGTIVRGNRPMLVYPLDVQLADGTIETITERAGIRTILQDCRPDVERCATLIFPVSFDQNGTTATYADAAAVRVGLATYRTANPDGPKATLIFPLSIEDIDGDTVEVASFGELRRLQVQCRSDLRQNLRDCFEFNYPLSLENRAGRVIEVETNAQLRRALSHANQGGRFGFQYPFDVTMEDGTVTTIDGPVALRRVRQGCR